MDEKDRQIIRVLQTDGRITNQDLAERVNLSPSPCLRRVRNLERERVIRGYAAEVDAKKVGLALTVFVRIRLERHTAEVVQHFESRIARLDEVLECHLMTGQQDYLLKVVASGLEAYEEFVRHRLHPIGGIGSIDSSFVYGTVKKTAVYPDP